MTKTRKTGNRRTTSMWDHHIKKCPVCSEWITRAKAMEAAGKLENVKFIKRPRRRPLKIVSPEDE